jgi:hypothetical protein
MTPVQVRARLMHAQSLSKSGDAAQAKQLTADAGEPTGRVAAVFRLKLPLQVVGQLRDSSASPRPAPNCWKSCVYGDDPVVMR